MKAGDAHMRENDETISFKGDMAVNYWVDMANNTREIAVAITVKDVDTNCTLLIENMNLMT
jgi:hypothetical protein